MNVSGSIDHAVLRGKRGQSSEVPRGTKRRHVRNRQTIEADLIVRRRVRTARLRNSLIVSDFGNNSRLAVSRYYAREGLIDLFCLTSAEQCHLPHNTFFLDQYSDVGAIIN